MTSTNVIWLVMEDMERDWLGTAIEYVAPRNGHKDRAAAATAILESNGVTQDPTNPAHFFVQSEEDGPFTVYEVHIGDPPSCTCDDHLQWPPCVYCKHCLAARRVWYLQRAWAREGGRTAPRRHLRIVKPTYSDVEIETDISAAWGSR